MAKRRLTPDQWTEIELKLSAGHQQTALAREYGVSEGTIRHHFGPAKKLRVEKAAQKIVEARKAKAELPPALQIRAETLADQLEHMSRVMLSSAELSAKTALRLAALANLQAQKIDDTDPSADHVRAVHALTDTSNKAAEQPLALLKANKGIETPADVPSGLDHFYGGS